MRGSILDSIIKRLLEYHRIDEKGDRGETSLRKVLEYIADILGVSGFDNSGDTKYVLHHKDGIHSNHTLTNLVLMPRGDHIRYHNMLRNKEVDKTSKEALNLFYSEGYANRCVLIGEMLDSMIKSGTEEENKLESVVYDSKVKEEIL